jgi:hypothetical protein
MQHGDCLYCLQERAEGHFDESGHYIENKDKDDVNDAWLASEEGGSGVTHGSIACRQCHH